MCGIFCSVSTGANNHVEPDPSLLVSLDNRGPDAKGCYSSTFRSSRVDLSIYIQANVLSLRGPNVVPQPLVDRDAQAALCWNGEAWKLGYHVVSGNDTKVVFEALSTGNRTIEDVVNAIYSITGPFAFCFVDDMNSRLYFGRDPLGRRSLLWKATRTTLFLSSVGDGTPGWEELESDGIYVVNFEGVNNELQRLNVKRVELKDFASAEVFCIPYSSQQRADSVNDEVPEPDQILRVSNEAVDALEMHLRNSLSLRLADLKSDSFSPVVHKLTSSTTAESFDASTMTTSNIQAARIAVLFSGGVDCTVLARIAHEIMHADEPIDLINVAFYNQHTHGAKGISIGDAFETCPDRLNARAALEELSNICPTRSWRLITVDITPQDFASCRTDIVKLMQPHNTEMDLSIASALYFAARGLGRCSDSLIPNTVHSCSGSPSSEGLFPYRTTARVLLSGLGADELLAGYQRHATAFRRGGFSSLAAELSLDVSRLGSRNLGRDDRVTTAWAREVRYPFLDEDLVSWAVRAPVWDKCGFGCDDDANVEPLEPGKLVLRKLALRLGLPRAAKEKKRAIQFGARSAKLEGGGKAKGTDLVQ